MDNSQPPTSRWLVFPRVLWISLAAGLAFSLLALMSGFMPDDYVYVGVLEGHAPPAPLSTTTFDLYRLISGDPAQMQPLLDKGVMPWWTLPDLRIAFFRPLSSALMVVDHALFGTNPVGYHVHTILWYLGLVAVVGVLLWRILPGAVGAMALLLFAIDDAHIASVAWLTNRSTVVAMFFAVLAVVLHLQWRQRGRAWAMPLSALALAVGLSAAETALLVSFYLISYELLGAEGPLPERLKALVPTLLVLLVYGVVRSRLGYGSTGSDMHIDPLAQPLFWLPFALLWVPITLGGVLLNAPVDMSIDAQFEMPLLIAGIVGMVVVGLMLRAAWRGMSEQERRQLRWLLAAFAVSVVGTATTAPSIRVNLVPSLGGAIIIAVVVHHAWRRRERNWGGRALVAGAGLLVFLHVIIAPYGWWSTLQMFRGFQASNARIQKHFEEVVDTKTLPQQRLVLLNAPHVMMGVYASVEWWANGKPLPAAWWVLTFDHLEQRVTRTGPATLVLERKSGRFFSTISERIHRSSSHQFSAGDEVKVNGMHVKVLEADAGGPSKLSFTFDVPLEDPSLLLLQWRDRKVRRFEIPPLANPSPANVEAVP
ncbi:DUF2637 domain-containing protein [Archangium lansingense]|uniref:DUF2637 domain-containing protein n=1 Tax=Archangium lansingense TaxID=2995310 RepID=A0ABT3ZWH6_9BACT|nr:DUF2637 domain-containing protein [Archangium lansinium]MCY1073757.1 DUF2637 domain-containing protein [Archangium lansinium]